MNTSEIIKLCLIMTMLALLLFGIYFIGYTHGVNLGITIELVNKTIEHSTLLEVGLK